MNPFKVWFGMTIPRSFMVGGTHSVSHHHAISEEKQFQDIWERTSSIWLSNIPFMKPTLYSLLFLILLSCAPGKNNETAADSTQNIVADTIATQVEETPPSSMNESVQSLSTVEPSEPFSGITNNFPEVSMAVLTNDSLEVRINNRMAELIQVYDTMLYATVTSSYSWERAYCYPSQDGPCIMGVETEEETKKWFFDRANQLKGYSYLMKSVSDEVTKSFLYLFSNDSLIAVREQEVNTSTGGFTSQVTILAAECPLCGITAIKYGDASYINEKELAAKQQEFYESMPELISILKAGRKKAKEDDVDFVFSINRTKEGDADEKSEAIKYSVEFRVTKSLYDNYISKQ